MIIRLEDDEGFEVGYAEDHDLLRPLIPGLDDEEYQLMGYVDPYGDTIFTFAQAAVLADELERAKVNARTPETVTLLDRIIELARQCAQQPHLYLKFLAE
ncbi:MAG: hypothetical protein H7Z75_06415 [Ferruginibacter sp.]|nr:hypothetical protein [Cytophagales bacterium]